MADKKINEEALNSVTGGMGDVNLSGSKVGGDQTVIDQSKTNIDKSIGKTEIDGDYTGGDKTSAGGDIVGGNKVDVDTKIKTDVSV